MYSKHTLCLPTCMPGRHPRTPLCPLRVQMEKQSRCVPLAGSPGPETLRPSLFSNIKPGLRFALIIRPARRRSKPTFCQTDLLLYFSIFFLLLIWCFVSLHPLHLKISPVMKSQDIAAVKALFVHELGHFTGTTSTRGT